jgi:hypothetical protein
MYAGDGKVADERVPKTVKIGVTTSVVDVET